MARGYIRRFQWTKAEEYLEQWLDREPENPRAFMLKALVEMKQNRRLKAINSYRQVLLLEPEQDEARLQLGELLLDETQAQEARPHLEYIRRRQPENANATVALARCYDLLGDQTEAQPLLDAVLEQHPNHAPALLQRGQLAMRADQPAAAESYLRRACTLEPGDLPAHYQLYQCLVKENKIAEAQEMMPKIQQIESDLQRMHDLATWQLEQAPHDPALMHEFGVILLRAGEEEQGLAWLERALIESNDRHIPTHKALADYYKKKGNNRLAAQHREKAGGEGSP
jgi:predicted Zn-dependent protease